MHHKRERKTGPTTVRTGPAYHCRWTGPLTFLWEEAAEPAGTQAEEDCRAAVGGAAAGSDWPPTAIEASQQPGKDTNSLTNQNSIFGCTMPTQIQATFSWSTWPVAFMSA
jgi:hypothetical protein